MDARNARLALRLYQDAWLFDYDSVRGFIKALDGLHSILETGGGQLSDKARIWHCLNCLEDADAEWATNLLDSTAALRPKPAYWTAFSTWAGFSKELICRAVDTTSLLSRQRTARRVSRKQRPRSRLFDIEKGALSDVSSISDDGVDTDTASYAGSYLEDGYETEYALQVRKANGSHNHNSAVNKGDMKLKASALASEHPRHPRPRRKFGSPLHEFTDYQFHCDDDNDFVDEDQKAVVINGERRFRIPGYSQARRHRRGLLIDAERDVLKFYFFKRFTYRPRCFECKLRHPVETYSFCRYCYFCHLGGEEECYHLHPELRGTRPVKGKYRNTLNPDPDIEYRKQTGPTSSIYGLSEFGYYSTNAITRGAVRKMRRRILLMPVEAQGDAVQALLQMITDDRCARRKAQEAKLAKEQQEKQQQREREERTKQAQQQPEKERLEPLAVELEERGRLKTEARKGKVPGPEPLVIQQWGAARQENQHRVEEKLEKTATHPTASNKGAPSKKKPRTPRPSSASSKPPPPPSVKNKRPPKPKPFARGTTPALPDQGQQGPSGLPPTSKSPFKGNRPAFPETTPTAPSTSRSPSTILDPSTTSALLGSNLIVPEQPPATAAPDVPTHTLGAGEVTIPQRLEAPTFMRNRRRWASMESLSTSSSEESIQQFDKKRQQAKNTMRGGASPRSSGPRRKAPGRATGGAALT